MSYKIVVDSCCDLPPEYHHDDRIEIVPLSLEVGDYHVMDDETFDQKEFLRRVAASEQCARSACPSPDRYKRAYETDADDVYVVTLSSRLSGSYNSALLGKKLYHEEKGEKNIHIIDSKSACCGEAQIAFHAMELADEGLPFDEVVRRTERYRDEMRTYFVLDNLDALRKNGRLTGLKAFVATTLNIKPVMGETDGTIIQRGQAIGTRKALLKMVDIVAHEIREPEKKRMMISHCNCYDRAVAVRGMLLSRIGFRDALLVDTAGVATLYAGDGGIVVTC